MLQKGYILRDTYEISDVIGKGGGGIVYKARHLRLNTDVVIKKIRDEIRTKVNTRQEADVLKRLKHPYLPRVYDFIEETDGVYTVMDYVPGKPLDVLLKERQRIPQQQAILWGRQLAEALSYLHRSTPPIIHADIKPANIIITTEGNVCLIDFNIAIVFDQSLKASLGVSVCYSPPEQYGNYETYRRITNVDTYQRIFLANAGYVVTKRNVDTRSDVYSLGCVLYRMIVGAAPDRDFERIIPISQTGIRISEGFSTLIERMMQAVPDDRYYDGSEVLTALNNLEKLDRRYIAYHRSQRLLAVVSALLLLAGAGLLGLGLKQREGESKEKYRQQILEADKLAENGDFESAIDIMKELEENDHYATELYEKELYYMYLSGDHNGCLDRCNEIYTLSIWDNNKNRESLSNIFYIAANAAYEEGDVVNADAYIDYAIEYNDTQPLLYRDKCVFAANLGKTDEAKEAYENAEKLGIDSDASLMLKGEIELMDGDTDEAVDDLKECINITKDSDIKRRAILSCFNALKEMGRYDEAERLILDETGNEDYNGQRILKEQLAVMYVNLSQETDQKDVYSRKAIDIYKDLTESGFKTYQMMENMAILHENLGEFDDAKRILEELADEYPNKYQVYKRLARLEADIQQKKDISERDYEKMKEYYDKANELYHNERTEDPEMLILDREMEDIRSGGWLDE